jgi:SAM-dependent methyltransferase
MSVTSIPYKAPAALTEYDLTMPRRKPRSIAVSLSYRLTRLARAIGLETAALRFLLFGSWIFWRLAYEISASRIGPEFENATRGVSVELLRRHIPPGALVLDFGCGAGRLTRMAAPLSGRVYGADRSEANVEAARRAGVPENVEYVCADAREVLAVREYDVVLAVHVIEHIDDVDALLQTMARQAKQIIIEVPNFEAEPLSSVRLALGTPFYFDADHVREYTPAILREQLARNGLRVVELEVRGATIVAVSGRNHAADFARSREMTRNGQAAK